MSVHPVDTKDLLAMNKYVMETGLFTLYCIAREMHADVTKFFKDLGVEDKYLCLHLGQYDRVVPEYSVGWPFLCQTKDGLMFLVETYPYAILTPLGTVWFVSGSSVTDYVQANDVITKRLLKKYACRLHSIIKAGYKFDWETMQYYHVTMEPSLRKRFKGNSGEEWLDSLKVIKKEDISNYFGTDAYIVSWMSGYGLVYSLTEHEGKPLPAPSLKTYEEHIDRETCIALWKFMKEKYDGEKLNG